MPGESSSVDNILSNTEYQEKLYELLSFYKDDLQWLIELATVENNGNRPAGLENEIYSVFHHIYRSIYCKNSVENACKELDTAMNSHLQRIQYDAYKIALNATLKESDKIIQDYEFLLLDPDFRDVLPNAVSIFQKIQETRKIIKDAYLEAKKYEREGKKTEVIAKYNEALSSVPILNEKISEIENDKRFSVALLSVKKKEDKEKQFVKISKRQAIIASIAAFASILAAAGLPAPLCCPYGLDMMPRNAEYRGYRGSNK